MNVNKLNLSVLVMAILFAMSLSACREGEAKDSAPDVKPYKATTVDECINEKDCVWYHFLLATQNHANPSEVSNDVVLRKWSGPIKIRIIGEKEELPAKVYEDYINQVFPYVSQKISLSKQYNFIIVETNDIEKELNGEFKKIALNALSQNKNSQKTKKIKIKQGTKCHNFYSVSAVNDNTINGYFSFIGRDSHSMEPCLKEMIYEGFGLSSINESTLFNGRSFSSQYSNLELFILYLFYNDAIQPHTSLVQMKKNFDEIYEPLLTYFNKQKDLIK